MSNWLVGVRHWRPSRRARIATTVLAVASILALVIGSGLSAARQAPPPGTQYGLAVGHVGQKLSPCQLRQAEADWYA